MTRSKRTLGISLAAVAILWLATLTLGPAQVRRTLVRQLPSTWQVSSSAHWPFLVHARVGWSRRVPESGEWFDRTYLWLGLWTVQLRESHVMI